FFLMINEAFVLGDKDFRLPGLGSYMSEAVQKSDIPAMLWAVGAMMAMIVLLDQLLWRPIVVWAQKFRIEEGGHQDTMKSWFLDWLLQSGIVQWVLHKTSKLISKPHQSLVATHEETSGKKDLRATIVSLFSFGLLLLILMWGGVRLFRLMKEITWDHWEIIM